MASRHHEEGGLIPIAHPTMRARFKVKLQKQRDGAYVATCDSPLCMSRAATEDEVLAKIRAEIRYRLEFCPCSGLSSEAIQLDVVRAR